MSVVATGLAIIGGVVVGVLIAMTVIWAATALGLGEKP